MEYRKATCTWVHSESSFGNEKLYFNISDWLRRRMYIGKLSHDDDNKHFVCIEIDEETRTYDKFKQYYPYVNDVTVLYGDFDNIVVDECFDCIFGDM